MFTKSVLIAAVLGLASASSSKGRQPVWEGISPNELVDIDVSDFVQDKIDEYMLRSEGQYNDYMVREGKHYRFDKEKRKHHWEWLKTESEIQTLNAHSNHGKFGHNHMSDWTQAARDRQNGTRVPKEDKDNHRVNEKLMAPKVRIAFQVEMTVEEYQALYDSEYAKTRYTCEYFNQWLTDMDRQYMSAQKELQRRNLVKKRKIYNNSEFEDYWFLIEQTRATVRGAIERCDDSVEPGPSPGPEPEPTPEPVGCDATASEFIWGSNVIPAIKNQGGCGSCYAFSANFVLEAGLAIASGDPVKTFSEQQIVDCQNNYSNCYGCSGGWPYSLHVSTRSNPIVLESAYPYTAREESCKSPSSAHLAAATDVYWVAMSPSAVKTELCHGPIQVALKANGPFSWYTGGVLDSGDCPYNNDLDHAVGVIGWTVKDGVESMIVRNSWGTGWGLNGYIYMALDTGNNGYGPCGIYHYMSSANVNMSIY